MTPESVRIHFLQDLFAVAGIDFHDSKLIDWPVEAGAIGCLRGGK